MMKTKLKLTRRPGAYYVVAADDLVVGYTKRAHDSGGWNFKPTAAGVARGWRPCWETTPRRAAEAAARMRDVWRDA